MTDVLHYPGPALRRLIAGCRPDVTDPAGPAVWASWRRPDVTVPARGDVLLSARWSADQGRRFVEDLERCGKTDPMRVRVLDEARETAWASQLAPHRITPADLPPAGETVWDLGRALSAEQLAHTELEPVDPRGKREANSRTVHLLHRPEDIVARGDFGGGVEAISTAGVHSVVDGGPSAVILSRESGYVGARRVDGSAWPVDGLTPVIAAGGVAMSWWPLPGWSRGEISGPGRGTQPGHVWLPGDERVTP